MKPPSPKTRSGDASWTSAGPSHRVAPVGASMMRGGKATIDPEIPAMATSW